MENITKISATKFSRPVEPEIVDIEEVTQRKRMLQRQLERLQEEIDKCDEIIGQAKEIGVEVAEVVEVQPLPVEKIK